MKIAKLDLPSQTKVATVELKKSVVITKKPLTSQDKASKESERQNITTKNAKKSKPAPQANNKSETLKLATDIIARHEWFHAKSYRDHKWRSIGYGTRGKKGEVITKQEAWNRMYAIVWQLYTKVLQDFPTLLPNQHAALISLKYNCHSGYVRLARSGITEAKFKSCNSASGKVLGGLVKRRANEWALFEKGVVY